MITIYGVSDDLVEIEGADYPNDEIGCYGKNVQIDFTDGTSIIVGYPKKNSATWWIAVEKYGTAAWKLKKCFDEEAEIYSDIFTIDSQILRVNICYKECAE